jgi:magnesium chelatase family protein
MNPCPCGHLGDGSNRCTCDPGLVARYRARLSGPLLDRIDLHVRVARLSAHELHDPEPGEGTVSVATRVLAANRWRSERQGRRNNAALTPGEVEASALLTSSGRQFLVDAAERLELSARGFHRVLRVARTIADLGLRERVKPDDLAEALCYRSGTPSPGAP